jgi:hypothetical protein
VHFPLKFLNFLTPGSGSGSVLGIRIPDPDPQSRWIRIQSGSGSTTLNKTLCGTVRFWDFELVPCIKLIPFQKTLVGIKMCPSWDKILLSTWRYYRYYTSKVIWDYLIIQFSDILLYVSIEAYLLVTCWLVLCGPLGPLRERQMCRLCCPGFPCIVWQFTYWLAGSPSSFDRPPWNSLQL